MGLRFHLLLPTLTDSNRFITAVQWTQETTFTNTA